MLFPIFLKLAGRKTVVIGGGRVAASKLDALLAARARVTVIAPDVRPEIVRKGVAVVRRPFRAGDLDDAWLAVAAAPVPVNRAVAAAARSRRVFVNAVDDPRHASAYLGGVVRRGDVILAISTSGRAPALAGLLREGLSALLPRDLRCWMTEARRLRRRWRDERVPLAARRPELLRALVRLYDGQAAASSAAEDRRTRR